MKDLEGRVAVVTGAGDGIGRAIARRLAGGGARILVAEINPVTGAAVARSITEESQVDAVFVQTDVRERTQVEHMVAEAGRRFGKVDILVNNAWGGGSFRKAENKTDAELQHGLSMNLWAAFWAMKAAFPFMHAQKWGRIINICSINGINAHTGTLEYNVGKEALRTLTRSMAREWAPYQICANAICPAAVTTAMHLFLAENPTVANGVPLPPMGRMGDPDSDIAGVAYFLAGEDARYCTGNTIHVDGGCHMNGLSWNVELPD